MSLSYQSSDEDMEVDSIYSSSQNRTNGDSDEDDIQNIECFSETQEFPPQLVAGRCMTTDLTECLNYLSLLETELSVPESYFTEPPEELIEWFIGNPPPHIMDNQQVFIPLLNVVK